MTTSRSDLRPRRRALRVMVATVLSVALVPLLAAATGGPDDVGYKIKPADSNLWSQRFRGGRLIGGGGCPRRCISFTFDDGPSWDTTPALLETLDRRGIHATFFVTGHRIDGDGEVARRNRAVLATEWRHGHLVGNHTYNHDLLDTMTEPTLRYELDRTEALIHGVIAERVWLFRAPFGALHHPRAVSAVFSREYTPVFWAMDSEDWRVNTPEAVLANVRAELDRAPRGGVLLMHDTLPWSIAAFPLILDEIATRNAALIARGEEPYEVVGLERFYEPLRAAPVRRRRR